MRSGTFELNCCGCLYGVGMPAFVPTYAAIRPTPKHDWARRQSGGAPDSRSEADEGRPDQHHCGFVTKSGRRNADTLHRYRRYRRRRLALVHGWTRGGSNRRGPQYNHPSGSTRRVRIVDNLFYDVNAQNWGGTGAFALIGDSPSDIDIEHNTVSQSGNIIMAYGGTKQEPRAITGFVFRDNVIRHNQYGVHGADRAIGSDTLEAFFPGAIFASNVIAGGDSARYPKGNTFISERDFDNAFMNGPAGDYRLKAGSQWRGVGSDKRDIGADVAAIAQALGIRTSR